MAWLTSLVLLLSVGSNASPFQKKDTLFNTIRELSDTSRRAIKPMGLFDLSFGATVHTARVAPESDPGKIVTNSAAGVSARMQNSVLWNYHAQKPSRRFVWGDLLSAEVFAGSLSTTLPHESGNVWVAYKFEFGFSGRLMINAHSEAGLHLILLEFSRDNVAGNISGSGVTGRFRTHRFLLEGGVIARHDRALGVLIDVRNKIPMQSTASVRYLFLKGRNVGVTAEVLPGTFHQDGFQYPKIWSLKLFYGIYF